MSSLPERDEVAYEIAKERFGAEPRPADLATDEAVEEAADMFGRLWALRESDPARYRTMLVDLLGEEEAALFL